MDKRVVAQRKTNVDSKKGTVIKMKIANKIWCVAKTIVSVTMTFGGTRLMIVVKDEKVCRKFVYTIDIINSQFNR